MQKKHVISTQQHLLSSTQRRPKSAPEKRGKLVATKTKTKTKLVVKRRNIFFGCRIDRDLVDRIRERAKENDRTIGAEMNRVLRAALAPEKEGLRQ